MKVISFFYQNYELSLELQFSKKFDETNFETASPKHHVYHIYRISYALRFYYVMYYIVLEMHIGERFLEDYFYCYSQQIMSAAANESLIPYNLIKRAPETQNF